MIAANKWEHYLGMYGDSLLVRVEDSTFEISISNSTKLDSIQYKIQYNTIHLKCNKILLCQDFGYFIVCDYLRGIVFY